MPAVTLQVQLPEHPVLPPEKIAEITGRTQTAKQMAWLEEHGWMFELDASGELVWERCTRTCAWRAWTRHR